MDFLNRIKKEMTEGIVRAILTDAKYRIIGLGVENVVREIECLKAIEYLGLDIPKAMRLLPDLLVMDREQTSKRLVEVKYRSKWSASIFDEVAEQVQLFGEIVLVYLNGTPPESSIGDGPSKYIRCCRVRYADGKQQAYLDSYGVKQWTNRDDIGDHDGQWWGLVPIQSIFDQINNAKEEQTLFTAIQSLRGILNA